MFKILKSLVHISYIKHCIARFSSKTYTVDFLILVFIAEYNPDIHTQKRTHTYVVVKSAIVVNGKPKASFSGACYCLVNMLLSNL